MRKRGYRLMAKAIDLSDGSSFIETAPIADVYES